MPEVIYAMTQRHQVFDGTDAPDLLAAVQYYYPAAYISASASYPGPEATVQIITDTNPNNAPMTFNFAAGDSWFQGGMFPAASLADTSFAVPLETYILDTVAGSGA